MIWTKACWPEVLMLSADSAQVNWDTEKKHWSVRVKIGEEVIRRPIPKVPQSAGDDVFTRQQQQERDGYGKLQRSP